MGLSDNTFVLSNMTKPELFAPFVIYAEFIEDSTLYGKKWEKIRAQEKTLHLIEQSLRDVLNDGNSFIDAYQCNFVFPVKRIVGFGSKTPKLAIDGYYRGGRNDDFPAKTKADDILLLNANVTETGQGSFDTANFVVNDEIKDFAEYLYGIMSDNDMFPFINRIRITTIDVNGVKFRTPL